MRWIVLFLILFCSTVALATEKTVMEHDGFAVEVLNDTAPQPYSVRKGVAYFSLGVPETTVFRLTNHTNERLQIVFTFNRLNPMTGREAVLQDNGFVLDPKQVLVISEGRLSKRKKDKPVRLFAQQPEGFFHFAVFKERTDYPLILPSMTPPPYGKDNFVVENGVRRWVPPARYPFRRVNAMPNYSFYGTYGR